MANRLKFTPTRRVQFLAALAAGNTVKHSCEQIGIVPPVAYNHRRNDPIFAAEWEDAYELGTQAMEQEAFRRAVEGVAEPVVSAGKLITYVQKHSDQILMFILKARRPAVYRDTVNIELHIRQAAIDAGVDPDAAVAEAQAILKESRASK